MSDFGSRVKEARLELGLSQKELGELVHVTQQNIGKIESGKAKNTYATRALAEHLNVNIDWLLTGKLPKRPSQGDTKRDAMVEQDPKRYRAASKLFERLMAMPPKQLNALEKLLDAFDKNR